MRQNLTNIAAKDLESLEHFYIVGSTTKEGLLDESTNVKIDLKKELAEAGGGSEEGGNFNIDDIILADDLLEKCRNLGVAPDTSVATDWTFSDICTQDSAGMLQSAFESHSGSEDSAKGIVVVDREKGLDVVSDYGEQEIFLIDSTFRWFYRITYAEGQYTVYARPLSS